ncbi:MAG: type II toxin-antitoxin system RelE/ParE family toxin [bacterium]|nr:type II toxin-antitoxin system RelE/ParE family toxin [bacterium]
MIAIEEVRGDLDDGEEFYDSQELGIGTYFRDCIISDIESLRLYAGIHEKHFGCYRMLATKFPYVIYYDIRDDAAIVIAVLDMRRNPAWIDKKMKSRKD